MLLRIVTSHVRKRTQHGQSVCKAFLLPVKRYLFYSFRQVCRHLHRRPGPPVNDRVHVAITRYLEYCWCRCPPAADCRTQRDLLVKSFPARAGASAAPVSSQRVPRSVPLLTSVSRCLHASRRTNHRRLDHLPHFHVDRFGVRDPSLCLLLYLPVYTLRSPLQQRRSMSATHRTPLRRRIRSSVLVDAAACVHVRECASAYRSVYKKYVSSLHCSSDAAGATSSSRLVSCRRLLHSLLCFNCSDLLSPRWHPRSLVSDGTLSPALERIHRAGAPAASAVTDSTPTVTQTGRRALERTEAAAATAVLSADLHRLGPQARREYMNPLDCSAGAAEKVTFLHTRSAATDVAASPAAGGLLCVKPQQPRAQFALLQRDVCGGSRPTYRSPSKDTPV
ncbi:unnamed protein product [Rangifer tarandus platyrhynchus]|uniref:Uncharacterized protein n=1 Tax=Rangifer tarandus platyrhynchus TaxID=3082113 RepID=A0ABN8XIZ6_RANTA|nr:unnamed protein product [Rangifer tarandus platyrhynchus]